MTPTDTSALRALRDTSKVNFVAALVSAADDLLDELDQLRGQVALTGVHFRCDCVPNEGPAHCHACSDSNGSPVEWRDCETVSGVRNLALEEAAHWLEVDSAGHENAGASMAEANALKVAAKCIRNGKRTNPFLATPADQKGAAS